MWIYYIDPKSLKMGAYDIWTVVGDDRKYMLRENSDIEMAIHFTFRTSFPNEPIPHNDPLSLIKLQAKGCMEETKIILGWKFDTVCHKLKQPWKKAQKWEAESKMIYHSRNGNTR